MQRILYGAGIAIGCGMLVWSCGSDTGPPFSAAGTSGEAGPDTSGSGGSTGGDGGSAGTSGSGGTGGQAGAGAAGSGGGGQGGAQASGGAAGDGGTGDGAAGDGAGGDGDADPCSACPDRCVDGGVCVECTLDAHCPTLEPRCDLTRNECVDCLPASDNCPSGQYCNDGKRCVKGCKDGTTCASGVCTSAHDCGRCTSDAECSGLKLCGSGQCNIACVASGPPGACGTGFTCCEPRCVRIDRDATNCGGCGAVCTAKQFCGQTGCTNAVLSNVCNLSLVTAVLDGAPADDPAASEILAGLVARCAPPPTTRTVPQLSTDVIHPTTGRVVLPGGEMLVFAGGRFYQKGVGFLEDQRDMPVYGGGTFPNVTLVRSSDGGIIASSTFEEPGSHDIFVIQLGREETTGTLSLVAYGFHANGTRAAAWYFVNVMLPSITTYTQSYYVYEWVDAAPGNLMPDSADSFTLRGSGL